MFKRHIRHRSLLETLLWTRADKDSWKCGCPLSSATRAVCLWDSYKRRGRRWRRDVSEAHVIRRLGPCVMGRLSLATQCCQDNNRSAAISRCQRHPDMSTPLESYRVYALKYAHHERRSGENFMGGDVHDHPMPLDYFVWAIVGDSRVFVVDTGFDTPMARQRGRVLNRPVQEGLRRLGIRTDDVEDVIITHMHYDHAGNLPLFPRARYHLQEREMAYCTGRCMCHDALSLAFEADHVKHMVGAVFERRVHFHDGTVSLTGGLSIHWVGGHTGGLQVVRVHTERGWVVLASDASHYYANMEQARPYPVVYNIGDMLEGYATVQRLADSPAHVVPGHDPLVLSRYSAHAPDTAGWIVRLDAEPH